MEKQSLFNKQWQATVGDMTSAVWLYALGGIAAGLLNLVDFALFPEEAIKHCINPLGGTFFNYFDGVVFPLKLCSIVFIAIGYALFYVSINRLAKLQKDAADRVAMNRVKKSYVFFLIGVCFEYIPTLGSFLNLLFIIIGVIMSLSGYSALKKSTALPIEARKGATVLRRAAVCTLIGGVVGCSFLLGDFIESIFSLMAFIMMLSGWNAIKYGAPELNEEEIALRHEEEQQLIARAPHPVIQGYLLLALMAVPVVVNLLYHFASPPEYLDAAICILLFVGILCYKKANVKGKYLVATCVFVLANILWIVLALLFSNNSMAYFGMNSMVKFFYLIAMGVFILPSRLSFALKVVFLFFSTGILLNVEVACVSWWREATQNAEFSGKIFYETSKIIELLVIAFLVWKNHKNLTKKAEMPIPSGN